jgi:hypothetical protein
MNFSPESLHRRSSHRSEPILFICPACRGNVETDSKQCPACQFIGARTSEMFSDTPPPLLPILDAAGIWNSGELRKIETARDEVRRRFPQIQWRICTVILPPETNLSLFGFWLMNACPLHDTETPEERAWSVLLLIDQATGHAATIPGYSAESCLTDDCWKDAIATMAPLWRAGKTADAVAAFFRSSRSHLEAAWKKNEARSSNR